MDIRERSKKFIKEALSFLMGLVPETVSLRYFRQRLSDEEANYMKLRKIHMECQEENLELKSRIEALKLEAIASQPLFSRRQLLETVEQLNKALKQRIDEFTQYKQRSDAEIQELKQQKFVRFNNEECWIYQGDETDCLGSLVCPVVIHPQTLMGIFATVARLEAERDKLRDEVSGIFIRHKIEWCGLHGFFSSSDEETPCAVCRLEKEVQMAQRNHNEIVSLWQEKVSKLEADNAGMLNSGGYSHMFDSRKKIEEQLFQALRYGEAMSQERNRSDRALAAVTKERDAELTDKAICESCLAEHDAVVKSLQSKIDVFRAAIKQQLDLMELRIK